MPSLARLRATQGRCCGYPGPIPQSALAPQSSSLVVLERLRIDKCERAFIVTCSVASSLWSSAVSLLRIVACRARAFVVTRFIGSSEHLERGLRLLNRIHAASTSSHLKQRVGGWRLSAAKPQGVRTGHCFAMPQALNRRNRPHDVLV